MPSLVATAAGGASFALHWDRTTTYQVSQTVGNIVTAITNAAAAAALPTTVMQTNQDNTMSGSNDIRFRDANQYIESSAADTLDIGANTTMNLEIGGSAVAVVTAGGVTMQGTDSFAFGAATENISSSVAGQLDIAAANIVVVTTADVSINASSSVAVDAPSAAVNSVYLNYDGMTEGVNASTVIKTRYNFATEGGLIGTINLGQKVPDNAIITRTYYQVVTTLTSATDAATVALGVATDAATGIVAAIAISDVSNPWDAGLKEGIQTGTMANAIQTAGLRNVIMTVAVENLTAGALDLFIEYVIGS
jgi:hypothetical protein